MAPAGLILASRSDRRGQLLRQGGYEFDQLPPPFEDPASPEQSGGGSAEAVAVDLADKKALSLLKIQDLDSAAPVVILAADTVCVDPSGRLIGQPRDGEDARQMIESFVNGTHQVITGVALVGSGQRQPQKLADAATVRIGPVEAGDIESYVASGAWRGKAGGYNLVERFEHGWPITVTGDPTTVVGLPMKKLGPVLAQWGVLPKSASATVNR